MKCNNQHSITMSEQEKQELETRVKTLEQEVAQLNI